jgi:pimeloyl-ACP methyl ester carboxylesterase
MSCRTALLAVVTIAGVLGMARSVAAQAIKYVRDMVPQGGEGNVPVVMVHGATLTGKSWETTPDGRMGWDEHFVRKGHPVYVPDQVGRGRSGFNQAIFNNVRAGSAPPASQPVWLRFSDEGVWPNFRFGLTPGAPFPDSQFPVAAVDELAKQGVPDMSFGMPRPSPTIKSLSDLATQLTGAVLMGHSQSGSFPLEAALLDSRAARGLVLVEPGRCARQQAQRREEVTAGPASRCRSSRRGVPAWTSIRTSRRQRSTSARSTSWACGTSTARASTGTANPRRRTASACRGCGRTSS